MSKVQLNKCLNSAGLTVRKGSVGILSEVTTRTLDAGFLGFDSETYYTFYFVSQGLRVDLEYDNKDEALKEREKLVWFNTN